MCWRWEDLGVGGCDAGLEVLVCTYVFITMWLRTGVCVGWGWGGAVHAAAQQTT